MWVISWYVDTTVKLLLGSLFLNKIKISQFGQLCGNSHNSANNSVQLCGLICELSIGTWTINSNVGYQLI